MVEKKKPTRTCVSCKKEFLKNELVRVVKNKDGEIFIDKSGKANGRGAYVCGGAECTKRLMRSKALDRAFKVSVPEEIYAAISEAVLGGK